MKKVSTDLLWFVYGGRQMAVLLRFLKVLPSSCTNSTGWRWYTAALSSHRHWFKNKEFSPPPRALSGHGQFCG